MRTEYLENTKFLILKAFGKCEARNYSFMQNDEKLLSFANIKHKLYFCAEIWYYNIDVLQNDYLILNFSCRRERHLP